MSGVFRTHSLGGKGVNSLEDARFCSVLFMYCYVSTLWVEPKTENGKALPVEVEEEGWEQAAGLYSSPTA
jgi:hypothetical protein